MATEERLQNDCWAVRKLEELATPVFLRDGLDPPRLDAGERIPELTLKSLGDISPGDRGVPVQPLMPVGCGRSGVEVQLDGKERLCCPDLPRHIGHSRSVSSPSILIEYFRRDTLAGQVGRELVRDLQVEVTLVDFEVG